jgi:hypothetical protein
MAVSTTKISPKAVLDLLGLHQRCLPPGGSEMKLYRCATYSTQWFAFCRGIGWLTFPAEPGGWQKRKPAPGIDTTDLNEVPIRLGFNTGIPGAAGSKNRTSGLRLEVAVKAA